jgi:hypothetical protein
MRRIAALPALALGLLGGVTLAGCAELGVPDIAGNTVDSILTAPESAEPGILVDPAASPTPVGTPAFFSSNDGYVMTIPAGWSATRVSPEETGLVLDLLGGSDPLLADLVRSAVDQTGAWVSMVGGDMAATGEGDLPPGVAVLVLPDVGSSDEEIQGFVADLIAGIPTQGQPRHKVVDTPAGDAHRFLLTVVGDAVGPVSVRAFLYSAGPNAVVVAFASAADASRRFEPVFDSMIKSLRFGV